MVPVDKGADGAPTAAGAFVMHTTDPVDHVAEPPGLILAEFLPYRLSVLANRVSQSMARLYQDRFGLSIAEWRVLAVIGQSDVLSSREIVELTAMDKAKVSRALTRLVDQGHLEREPHPQDQRTNRVRFSAKGRSIYAQVVPSARAWEAALLTGMTAEDRASLARLMSALDARVSDLANPPDETGS